MEWKLPLFKTYWDNADIDAVSSVIKRGSYWATGPELAEFEKKISSFVGTKYGLSFSSGTSALHTLLLAHKIEGEVIVPSFTFIATSNAVLLAGAEPVFAESEDETFGLDADDVESRITDKTSALINIQYGGMSSRDTKKLRRLADENGILFLDDSAESLGSSIDGKMTGSFAHSSIFSFCQNKVISTGEGGIILTDDEDVYERAKLLRSHGRVEMAQDYFANTEDNDYVSPGYNFRMSSMTAALGISQLGKIDELIKRRRENAQYLNDALSGLPLELPIEGNGRHYVYQMYTVKLPDEKTRDALQKHLSSKGIMSKVYFNPVHLKTLYTQRGCREGQLPFTEALSKRVLTLPMYVEMGDDLEYLAESIKEFYK